MIPSEEEAETFASGRRIASTRDFGSWPSDGNGRLDEKIPAECSGLWVYISGCTGKKLRAGAQKIRPI
jgi:hypothetical protein